MLRRFYRISQRTDRIRCERTFNGGTEQERREIGSDTYVLIETVTVFSLGIYTHLHSGQRQQANDL